MGFWLDSLIAGSVFWICVYYIFRITVYIFAVIGLVTVIKAIAGKGKSKKETPGEYWRRTGKLKN